MDIPTEGCHVGHQKIRWSPPRSLTLLGNMTCSAHTATSTCPPSKSLKSCLPSGVQTTDLLIPESLKYTVTCPGPPDGTGCREQRDQAKLQRELPRLATGLGDVQRGEEKQKGKTSTPHCCSTSITLPNTYFQACLRGQAQLCLKSRRLQRCPAPAGSSLHAGLAGAGTGGMCPSVRGDEWWLAGRGHRARLPSTQPQRAGHREAEQGRVLCWHAAASTATAGTWLERGHANTCRRERRLFGHGTAALRSLCCSWGPAPGNVLAQRGKRDKPRFSSAQRTDVLSSFKTQWSSGSMVHEPLLSAPLPSPRGR